jgi:hypothetical protein
LAARPQPQQRRDARKGGLWLTATRGFVGQGEELCVFLEALGHREFVGELVIALDRLAVRCFAGNRGRHARLGDVVADAVFFPFGIAGAQALLAQCFLLVGGHLVVGDANTLATTTILVIQAHHSVGCCAGTREEVKNHPFG